MTRSSASRHAQSDSPLASLAVGVAAFLLASCAVGPRFRAPEAPSVADTNHPYTPGPLPTSTDSAPGAGGGAAQRFVSGQAVPADWWTLFHSEPLDRLLRAAMTQSPTVASAQAALREAKEAYAAGFGNSFLPSVSAQVGGARERVSEAAFGLTGGSLFTLYNASVNVAYAPDVFGGARRGQEGLGAARDFQRFELEAAYLSLSANLVTTAIQEASLRAQVRATRELVSADSQALVIAQKQGALGAVALSTVLAQQTALAQTEATLPVLENALAQTRHLLAVFAGRLPSDNELPEFDLDSLELPADLPVSLPSSLVRQRPDVCASEAVLHEASAQIGVATADLLPQFTLSGSGGWEGVSLSTLLSAPNEVWSLGAGVLQPIFHGGALRAKRREAIAAFDAARAQYQQTVLNAFLNVADALRALDADAQTLRVQAVADSFAGQTYHLVAQQYRLGAVSYLALLDAQRSYTAARLALVQARAARYADTAALFTALGGGWWNRADTERAPPDTETPAPRR
jgi:NodT family efflux transporter outer membrane factor (OMF) lipoprotein